MTCNALSALSRASVPIGIPAVFLRDPVHRRRAAIDELAVEFDGARGHSYAWGYLIETRHIAPFAGWRIVPVELWDRLAPTLLQHSVGAVELLPRLAPIVQRCVRPQLPVGLQLAGLQATGRRSPHALFCLLLTDAAAHRRARLWIERRLLPTLLPQVLQEAETALRQCLGAIDTQAATDDASPEC